MPQNSSVHFDVLFSDKIREKINPDYKVAWWNGWDDNVCNPAEWIFRRRF